MKNPRGTLFNEGVRERSVHVEADWSSMVLEIVDSLPALFWKATSNPLGRGLEEEEQGGFLLL